MVGDGTWLTVGEAAERLMVSAEAVRRAIKSGKLTARRTPGGHRRVSSESVERLYRELGQDGVGEQPPSPENGA